MNASQLPHTGQSHHAFCPLPKVTCSGVSGAFFTGSHSAARVGNSEASERALGRRISVSAAVAAQGASVAR
jgi:hypothetical protein